MASVPLAVLSGVALLVLNGPFLEELIKTFNQALAQLEQDLQQDGSQQLAFNALSIPQVAALLATGNAVIAVLSLMLGRYWQALLYNPGGFGSEFRALKMPQSAVLAMASIALVLWWLGPEWRVWSAVSVLPLTVVGVCADPCVCGTEARVGLAHPDVCAVDRARSHEVVMGGMRCDRRICRF